MTKHWTKYHRKGDTIELFNTLTNMKILTNVTQEDVEDMVQTVYTYCIGLSLAVILILGLT